MARTERRGDVLFRSLEHERHLLAIQEGGPVLISKQTVRASRHLFPAESSSNRILLSVWVVNRYQWYDWLARPWVIQEPETTGFCISERVI